MRFIRSSPMRLRSSRLALRMPVRRETWLITMCSFFSFGSTSTKCSRCRCLPALALVLVVGVEEGDLGDQDLRVLHVGLIEDRRRSSCRRGTRPAAPRGGTGSRRRDLRISASSGPGLPMYSGLSFSRMLISE